MGVRYYNPVMGRYLSRDPLGYGDGLNNYLHVHNNPINDIDPLGLEDTPASGPSPALSSGGSNSNSSQNGTSQNNSEGNSDDAFKKAFKRDPIGAVLNSIVDDSGANNIDSSLPGLNSLSNEISRGQQASANGDSALALVAGDLSGVNQYIDSFTGTDRLTGQPLTEDEASARGYEGFSKFISLASGRSLGALDALGESSLENTGRTLLLPKPGSAGGPGAGKRFANSIKDAAEAEANSKCVFCGRDTTRVPGPTQRNTDHAIPMSIGSALIGDWASFAHDQAQTPSNRQLQGVLDSFGILSRAMTGGEIAELSASGSP